jgi:hypothetical protein
MKTKTMLLIVIVFSLTVVGISRSFAQTDPVFVQLGQAKGALYKPDSGPPPTLASWSCIGSRTT